MKSALFLLALVGFVAINSGCGDPSSAQVPKVVTRQQPTTRIYVRTVPPGAKIVIDGKAKGESDQLFTMPADVERITVEVELDGSRGRKEVAVRGGEVTRVEFDLRKQAAARPAAVAAASDSTRPWIEQALQKLPEGWKVIMIPQLAPDFRGVQQRLGGKITRLWSGRFLAHDEMVMVNVIEAPTDADSAKLEKGLLGIKDKAFCYRADNRTIIEFVGRFDADFARRLARELGLVSDEQSEPADDTIIESRVLGQAFAELVAESMVARQQAGAAVPDTWNTPQFVPEMLKRLKEEVPGCLEITAAEERKLAAGEFDDAAGEARVRAALETLSEYNAGLPPIHQFLIERFRKGKLSGAGLVFTVRMMEATAAKAAAVVPNGPPPTPPDHEVPVTTIGQVHKSPPVVVQTVPPSGNIEVDPGLTEVRVTFSKAMTDGSWSWSQLSDETFPESAGQPKYLPDGRTCVLPVRLAPGKTYAIWLNSQRFTGFRDAQGNPAVPYLLVFETRE